MTRRRRLQRLAFFGSLVFFAFALALGLGLGLTVHRDDDSASTVTSSADSASTELHTSPGSNFVLDSIAGQPPQTREFNFVLSQVQGAPDGVSRPMLVVNNIFPGPTIQANQGDRLIVNVQNNLPNASSIHWHGLFQNGTNHYDGTSGVTECGIPPGKSLTYNFTFGEFSGTTWWHAHSAQYTDGLTGALIVHPTAPAPPGFPEWDEELVVQMSDWYHDVSEALLVQYFDRAGIRGTPGNEPVPETATLNGLGQYGSGGTYFNFTLQRNKKYRIRLANTGSLANMRFSVDSHPLTVIEAEGTLVEPQDVASVTLAVAQRISVILHTNGTADSYWMRASMQTDMFSYDLIGQNTDIRGIIRFTDSQGDALPGPTDSGDPGPGSNLPQLDAVGESLVPLVRDPAPESTVSYVVRTSFQKTDQLRWLGFMNGTSWEPMRGQSTLLAIRQAGASFVPEGSHVSWGDQLFVTQDSIQVVDLLMDNLDDGDHPFHLHGHRPWIMGGGPGRYIGQPLNSTHQLRRDTIMVPAYSWTVMRFVTDNAGVWAFHCHLAWHMAAGLFMQFNTLPSRAVQVPVPQDIIDHCAAAAT